MVCTGFENSNEDGIPTSCDAPKSSGKFHGSASGAPLPLPLLQPGMASNCGLLGRWGRRKQANPKRTNVDDDDTVLEHSQPLEGLSCDSNPIGSPHIPALDDPEDVANLCDGDDDKNINDDIIIDDRATTAITKTTALTAAAAPVDGSLVKGIAAAGNTDSSTDAIKTGTSGNSGLVEGLTDTAEDENIANMVPQESNGSPRPAEQESVLNAEKSSLESNGIHGNNDDGMSIDPEDEKIQELMNRSDTAVIYPEPVSDQEEGTATTENEDLCDVDDEEDQVNCHHCDQSFRSVENLKIHWHATHGSLISKYNCLQCSVSFPTKSQLEKHTSLHSPSSQICKICKKTFANVYRLQRHMISHEESTELRKFKCPECGKAFKFKHHLKEHIRIHSGEKPFECQNCGKRFSHSGSYSSHMTSKKCWIVNLKMRGGSGGGNTSASPEKQDKSSRPLVPKPMDSGLDLNLASMMYGSGLLPQQFMPLDPATATQMQTHFLLNGASPFLPHFPFSNPMTNGLYPGMANTEVFGGLPSGGVVDKDMKMMGSLSESATIADKKGDKDASAQEATDENQNEKKELKKIKVEKNIDSEAATNTEAGSNEKVDAAKENQMETKGKESMAAINKVLEIVGATVSQQQVNKEDKGAYSKLSEGGKVQEDESRTLTALASAATQQLQQLMKETKSDDEGSATVKTEPQNSSEEKSDTCEIPATSKVPSRESIGLNPCKFCKKTFTSPISLHQHERYLCKLNQEIQRLEPESHANNSNEIVSPSISCNDDEQSTDSERKIRVRSMITDEQVKILKSFYVRNQRPNKYELESLAQKIGFPKRVVQVWFQNMRARDRRKGRTIRENIVGSSPDMPSSTATTTTISSACYIPIVPQVAMPTQISHPVYYPTMTSSSMSPYISSASPQRASEAVSAPEQPLDLTVKRPEAHTNKPYSSRPDPDQSGEVLNLSVKESCEARIDSPRRSPILHQTSPAPGTPAESVVKHDSPSPAKEEAGSLLAERSFTTTPLVVPIIPSSSASHVPLSVPLQINTTPAHSRSYASVTSMHPSAFSQQPAPAHHAAPTRLMFDGSLSTASSPSMTAEVVSPAPCSLDNSFNSNASIESNSSSPYTHLHKPKRARKKSWRQVGGAVESEDQLHDMDESVDEDGECSIARKKRRSWKQHRVDVAEGLYACDQCDKMFSKQSSLARHKYEHSGQRPFPCDICTKAFKHKHHLTEHKRLHSGEKPFQCQKCGKRFSHSGSYSQHMNHRYKYCKPLRAGEMGDNFDSGPEMDAEMEHSEASP